VPIRSLIPSHRMLLWSKIMVVSVTRMVGPEGIQMSFMRSINFSRNVASAPDAGRQCGEMADHFACVSSHASASSSEKEYSWSRTPERILPPSARFMM
jgi:hypothetical protein